MQGYVCTKIWYFMDYIQSFGPIQKYNQIYQGRKGFSNRYITDLI